MVVRLQETQRTKISHMVGYGGEIRSQQEIRCEIFNTKYPEDRINQTSVSSVI